MCLMFTSDLQKQNPDTLLSADVTIKTLGIFENVFIEFFTQINCFYTYIYTHICIQTRGLNDVQKREISSRQATETKKNRKQST